MADHGHQAAPGKTPGYETRDVNTRIIWIAGIVIAVIVVASMAYMHSVFNYLTRKIEGARPAPSVLAEKDILPPAPRLRVNPLVELDELHAQEEQLLNSYAWVDEAAGVARIPVARAMEFVAAHGVPAMTAPAPAPADTNAPAADPHAGQGHSSPAPEAP